ncbi:MAG: hypothetical protein JO019_04345 [Candidatus Kaiserbacteria bacterium]|nr:hypothetical protein [Candidatus Kaiserbacteria bacterium]
MNWERSILISFLGNYINNNVVAAIVALFPASTSGGVFTVQYVMYVILAAIVVGLLTWWYGARSLQSGAIFGVIGFVVAIVTAFITGITGVLTQTGSLSQMVSILPNFWPFLASWSTLVLLGYWVIPAALVGWWHGRSMPARHMPTGVSM